MWYQYKMTQYNSLNVKLSSSQLDKLKLAIKKAETILRYHQIWWVILMMKLNFHINYC